MKRSENFFLDIGRQTIYLWGQTAVCLFLTVGGFFFTPTNAHAQAVSMVEIRRTLDAPGCQMGDIYIDGHLRAMFLTSQSLFENLSIEGTMYSGILKTTTFDDVMPGLVGVQHGMVFDPQFGGRKPITFVALNEFTKYAKRYSEYLHPRKRNYDIPPDHVVVGTRASLRECEISVDAEHPISNASTYLDAISILMSNIFSMGPSAVPFEAGMEVRAFLILTDASKQQVIKFNNTVFRIETPIRPAFNGIADGDKCLLDAEHMRNRRRLSGGGTEYKRTDRVLFCTSGTMTGSPTNLGLEVYRDVRFSVLYSREICGKVLGIPLERTFLIEKDDRGRGQKVWMWCFGTDEPKVVAETGVLFDSGG